MPAENRKKQPPTLHTPPPPQGAHHGPGAGPGVSETISAFFDRLKQKGILNYRVLALLGVMLVGILVYRYVSSTRKNSSSFEWMKLELASTVDRLSQVAASDPNRYPAKVAEVDLARYRLTNGITLLQSSEPANHIKGSESIDKAREDFLRLADVFQADKVQRPECLWGAAKAEEALIGVPKKANSLEHMGLVSKAVEYYQKTAEAARDTPLGKLAKAKAEELNKNANIVTSLQSDLFGSISKGVSPFDPKGPAPFDSFPSRPGTDTPLPPLIPGLPSGPEEKTGPPATPKADTTPPVTVPVPKVDPAPASKAEPPPVPKASEPSSSTPPAKSP